MLKQIALLQSLVGNGMLLSKAEAIRRYRSLKTADYFVLQLLFMLPFSSVGKDDEGNLYYY